MPGTETANSAAVPFDPYELKDVVGGTIRDPYPLLHELRRQSPVHTGPIDIGEGIDEQDPNKPSPVTVFGFDEVVQVLKDNETYSSNVYSDVMGMVMGRTVLEMDEPEHRQNRALVAGSFRTKMLERWEEDLVALVVNELIDSFIDAGRADLVRTITFNYPVQVIARILGLPRSDYPIFQRWAIELTSVAANWERGVAASVALRDYFAEVMAERRSHAGRRPHQRPGAGRGRRREADRRGDLLLPASDPAGRCRDHLPGLGQHALRPAARPGPVRCAVRGPLPLSAGLRGGPALGAPRDRHLAPGHRATPSWPGSRSSGAPTSG